VGPSALQHRCPKPRAQVPRLVQHILPQTTKRIIAYLVFVPLALPLTLGAVKSFGTKEMWRSSRRPRCGGEARRLGHAFSGCSGESDASARKLLLALQNSGSPGDTQRWFPRPGWAQPNSAMWGISRLGRKSSTTSLESMGLDRHAEVREANAAPLQIRAPDAHYGSTIEG